MTEAHTLDLNQPTLRYDLTYQCHADQQEVIYSDHQGLLLALQAIRPNLVQQ